jgi:hypothetical protein
LTPEVLTSHLDRSSVAPSQRRDPPADHQTLLDHRARGLVVVDFSKVCGSESGVIGCFRNPNPGDRHFSVDFRG